MTNLIRKINIAFLSFLVSLFMISPALGAQEVSSTQRVRLAERNTSALFRSFNHQFQKERKRLTEELKREERDEKQEENNQGEKSSAQTNITVSSSGSVAVTPPPEFVFVQGSLVSVSSQTQPSELVIKVLQSWPALSNDTLTVKVDTNTHIVARFFGKSSLGELMVGDSLQVFGGLDSSGALQAIVVKDNSIQAARRQGDIILVDAVNQSFVLSPTGATSSSTADLTVRTTQETTFTSTDGARLTFADLKVGEHAVVAGVLNSQVRSLLARSVRVNISVPVPLPFSLQGVLQSVSSTSVPAVLTVKVNDILPPLESRVALKAQLPSTDIVTVHVDSASKLEAQGGATVTLADLHQNDALAINASLNADGSITATLVRDKSLSRSTLNGRITSIDTVQHTIMLAREPEPLSTGGSNRIIVPPTRLVTVSVSNQTKIVNANGDSVGFNDLKADDHIHVSGLYNNQAQTLAADKIVRLNPAPVPLPFSFHGSLTAMSGTSLPARLTLKINDIQPPLNAAANLRVPQLNDTVTFTVDSSTRLVDRTNVQISLNDLEIGDMLAINAELNANGTVMAELVQDTSIRTVNTTSKVLLNP